MKREYWIILIVYIAMQLSSLAGMPATAFLLTQSGMNPAEAQINAVNYWLLISFTAALLLILFFLRKEIANRSLARAEIDVSASIGWAISGVFLALIAQSLAASVERLLGIEMGSENTEQIIKLIENFPAVMIVSSVIGPILEEIVFRKVIFGSLHKRFNFFISALISSVIFALAHFEPEHILLYSAMGFTFAFLYVRTKQIIVPIFAHVAMNTLVVLLQSVFKEDIEKMVRDAEKIQNFIGGFL